MANPNIAQFGLSEAHYATFTYDALTETYTYDTPKKIMCAVTLSLSPIGDSTNFYCDNKVGFTSVANQGYEGSLEGAIMFPDFRADVMNEQVDDNGVQVEYANLQPNPFAFMFQVEGNEAPVRFILWNCKATRPSIDANTSTESVEVDTQTLEFTAAPRENDFLVKGEVPSTDAAYATWFDAVYEPIFTPPTP